MNHCHVDIETDEHERHTEQRAAEQEDAEFADAIHSLFTEKL